MVHIICMASVNNLHTEGDTWSATTDREGSCSSPISIRFSNRWVPVSDTQALARRWLLPWTRPLQMRDTPQLAIILSISTPRILPLTDNLQYPHTAHLAYDYAGISCHKEKWDLIHVFLRLLEPATRTNWAHPSPLPLPSPELLYSPPRSSMRRHTGPEPPQPKSGLGPHRRHRPRHPHSRTASSRSLLRSVLGWCPGSSGHFLSRSCRL